MNGDAEIFPEEPKNAFQAVVPLICAWGPVRAAEQSGHSCHAAQILTDWLVDYDAQTTVIKTTA